MSFCQSTRFISTPWLINFDSTTVRNTYTLLDAGDTVDDSVDRIGPYIQLASIIDPVAAQQDFVNIRLNGNASALSDPAYALLPSNETQHSPIPPGEKTKELEEKVLSRLPYIVLGAAVLLALITACCIWHCCCRRKGRGGCCRRKAKNLASNDPRGFVAGTGDVTYVPLALRPDNQSVHSLPPYHGKDQFMYSGNYGSGGSGYDDYKH